MAMTIEYRYFSSSHNLGFYLGPKRCATIQHQILYVKNKNKNNHQIIGIRKKLLDKHTHMLIF